MHAQRTRETSVSSRIFARMQKLIAAAAGIMQKKKKKKEMKRKKGEGTEQRGGREAAIRLYANNEAAPVFRMAFRRTETDAARKRDCNNIKRWMRIAPIQMAHPAISQLFPPLLFCGPFPVAAPSISFAQFFLAFAQE